MSAATKSEKATPKKRKDSAERGQSFKARDLVVACLTLCGVLYVVWFGTLGAVGATYVSLVRANFEVNMHDYVISVLLAGLKTIGPVVLLAIFATAIPSLLQSGFILATKAFKINFGAINPAKGFKKIFSMRTIKDAIKTLLYLSSFVVAFTLLWSKDRGLIFSQLNADIPTLIGIWGQLLLDLVLLCLLCIVIIIVIDALMELFLYLKDLKMDKQEVKREHKEMDGDPLIKGKRRERHMELLSEQEKSDVKNSRAIIANPTHIAIGIYFKPEVSPIPFISIRQTNQRALAIRKYAKEVGVPVIVDIPLARRLYATHNLYDMIKLEEVRPVLQLLAWLQTLEMSDAEREELARWEADQARQQAAEVKRQTEDRKVDVIDSADSSNSTHS